MAGEDIAQRDGSPLGAIMAAAMRLFGNQGYTGTSMRDIAGAVGVLPGSLYAHIRSKEALLVDIVSDGIDHFQKAIEPIAASDAPPIDRLRRMIVAHVEVVSDNPDRALVVFHQFRYLGPESLAKVAARLRAYQNVFVTVVSAGIEDGKLRQDLHKRITVISMLGALNVIPEWYVPEGSLTVAEIANLIADTLLNGIQV